MMKDSGQVTINVFLHDVHKQVGQTKMENVPFLHLQKLSSSPFRLHTWTWTNCRSVSASLKVLNTLLIPDGKFGKTDVLWIKELKFIKSQILMKQIKAKYKH